MREHKKKWLFDKGKSSGSRKRWSYGGDFADDRNTKKSKDIDNAPQKVGMKTGKVFRNRLNFSPLLRYLKNKVGKNWNEVYSEIKERIPKDVWDTHNPVEWYVYTKVRIHRDGSISDLKARNLFYKLLSKDGIKREYCGHITYYVHPKTNILCRLEPDTSYKGKPKLEKSEKKKKHSELKVQTKKRKEGWEKERQDKSNVAALVMKVKKKNKNDIQEGQGDKK